VNNFNSDAVSKVGGAANLAKIQAFVLDVQGMFAHFGTLHIRISATDGDGGGANRSIRRAVALLIVILGAIRPHAVQIIDAVGDITCVGTAISGLAGDVGEHCRKEGNDGDDEGLLKIHLYIHKSVMGR